MVQASGNRTEAARALVRRVSPIGGAQHPAKYSFEHDRQSLPTCKPCLCDATGGEIAGEATEMMVPLMEAIVNSVAATAPPPGDGFHASACCGSPSETGFSIDGDTRCYGAAIHTWMLTPQLIRNVFSLRWNRSRVTTIGACSTVQ